MGPGISYRDWVKKAGSGGLLELTSTSGTNVLPLSNAQNPILREVASYSTNTAEITLTYNSGVLSTNPWTNESGLTVGCVGLFNLEFGLAGIINVKVYADDDNVTPVMNKSYVIQTPSNFNLEYTQVNPFLVFDQVYSEVQKVVIQISSSPVISKIGRIWIGNYMEANFDAGWDIGLDAESNVNYSSGRDAHPIFSRRSRKASFAFGTIPYSKAYGVHNGATIINTGTFNDLMMTAGKDSEIVVHPLTTDFDISAHPPLPTTMYGLISKDPVIRHQSGKYFQTQIDAIELI